MSARRHLRSAATPTLVVPRRPVVLHLATSVSCGCRTRLEPSAILAASSLVTYDVQAVHPGRIQKCGLGDRVPKHSNGGTDGVESGRGIGVGSGEGVVHLPRKNFSMFSFEMVHFDAFWRTF